MARSNAKKSLTAYVVLRAVEAPPGEEAPVDVWAVVGEVSAHSGPAACKLAAGGGAETQPGRYWAVPAASRGNQLIVHAQQQMVVSYEKPLSGAAATLPNGGQPTARRARQRVAAES